MVSQSDAKRDPQELTKEPTAAKNVRERQPEPVQGARRQPADVQEGAKCAGRPSRGGHMTSKMLIQHPEGAERAPRATPKPLQKAPILRPFKNSDFKGSPLRNQRFWEARAVTKPPRTQPESVVATGQRLEEVRRSPGAATEEPLEGQEAAK